MGDNVISGAKKSAEELTAAAKHANKAVEALTKTVFSTGKGFEGLVKSSQEVGKFMTSATSAVDTLGKALNIPGIKTATGMLAGLGGMVGGLIGTIGELGNTYIESLNAFDSFSAGLREMDDDMFQLAARFGGTFDEAKDFTDGIGKLAAQVSGAGFGYIDPSELKDTAKLLASNRISLERFSDTVVSSAGSMDLLTTATLQSAASGLTDYYSKLGDAIMRQGLDSQQAAEQIASFRDVAGETGLTSQSVADTLNDLSNSFSKLGLSADFGRPLVIGFARTLDDMGLGIENAIGLSSELSKALAGLTTDYAMAFVTAQRGGMDLGGGGVLGAGISMQAKLLESQQSGDEGAQADFAREMVTGLKDTIASFAGGQIVTVKEADENPALAATFYTQTKLLEDMYGIDQQSSARTLDLLSNLDDAIKSGDKDAQDKLAEQIGVSIENRDETLDLMDKQNALTAGILAETMVQTRALMFLPRAFGEESVMDPVNEKFLEGLSAGQEKLIEFQKETLGRISESGKDEGLSAAFGSLFKEQEIDGARDRVLADVADQPKRGRGATSPSGDETKVLRAIAELVRVLQGRVIGDKSTSDVTGG